MFMPVQVRCGHERASRPEPESRARPMRLFSPDLLRNFSIGFVIGALLIAGANARNWEREFSARAAPMPERIEPAAEFLVVPAEAR